MKLSHYKRAIGDEPLRGIWKTVNDDIQAVNKATEDFKTVINSIKSPQSDVASWGRKVSGLATMYAEYESKLAVFQVHHDQILTDQNGDKKSEKIKKRLIKEYQDETTHWLHSVGFNRHWCLMCYQYGIISNPRTEPGSVVIPKFKNRNVTRNDERDGFDHTVITVMDHAVLQKVGRIQSVVSFTRFEKQLSFTGASHQPISFSYHWFFLWPTSTSPD